MGVVGLILILIVGGFCGCWGFYFGFDYGCCGFDCSFVFDGLLIWVMFHFFACLFLWILCLMGLLQLDGGSQFVFVLGMRVQQSGF